MMRNYHSVLAVLFWGSSLPFLPSNEKKCMGIKDSPRYKFADAVDYGFVEASGGGGVQDLIFCLVWN